MEYSQSSRYHNLDEEIPQLPLLKINVSYERTVVQTNEAHRLDLVSQRVYNTPVYWWLIARFNSIIDVENVYPGMSLRIPNIMEIQL